MKTSFLNLQKFLEEQVVNKKSIIKKGLLSLAIVIGFGMPKSIIAGNNSTIEKAKKEQIQENVKDKISSEIKFPKHLKSEITDEKVHVSFECDNTGKVKTLIVESDNVDLKNYVISQFNKIKLDLAYPNLDYCIDLIFKVL